MTTWCALLLARVFASVVLLVIGVFVANRYWARLRAGHILLWFGVRAMSMLVLVCALHQIPPDVTGWYTHAHWMINQGAIPGLDFRSPYYLGFNALLAFSVSLYDSPISIVLCFMLFDLLAVFVWKAALKGLWNEKIANQTILLYLTSPIFFACSWLGAQDETIALLAMGLFMLLLAKGKKGGTILLVASVVFSKILTVFYLVPYALMKRFRHVALLLLGLVVYLVVVMCFGINPFDMRFGRELGIDSASADAIMTMCTAGNIWSLIPKSYHHLAQPICLVGLMIIYAVSAGLCSEEQKSQTRIEGLLLLSCASFIVFCLFYPMTFGSYCIPMVIPLLLATQIGHAPSRSFLVLVSVWATFMAWKDNFKWGIASLPQSIASELVLGIDILTILLNIAILAFLLMRYRQYGLLTYEKIKLGFQSLLSPRQW